MTDFTTSSDSELVHDALAGDMSAFAEMYDRYADRLNTYCFAMLRDRDDAADAVQDTFVKAATKLGQLKDGTKLRSWLFSIARNEAHARGRQRARSAPVADLSETLVDEPDMSAGLRQTELKAMVWAAADGLSDRDRELMTLNLVEGLEGVELATALGVSTSHVHVLVSRMKDRVEKSIGALLIARLGRDDCDELQAVLAGWDGRFSLDVRSRVTRHVESCDTCIERRGILLSPSNVLPSIALIPAPASLRGTVLDDIETRLGLGSTSGGWKNAAAAGVVGALILVAGWFGLDAQNQQGADTPMPVAQVVAPSTTATATPTTTATTSTVPSTTTLSPAPPPVTLADPTPASLSVSNASILFGDAEVIATIELRNDGDESTDWLSAVDLPAVSVTPAGGLIAGGETLTITVNLDRTQLVEGQTEARMIVMSPESTIPIAVFASFFENPIVQPPQLSVTEVFARGGSCIPLRTTVSVVVTDSSDLASVVLRWSPTASQTATIDMAAVGGNTYSLTIGPYLVTGTATVAITATDVHGNAAGATTQLNVLSC